MIEAARSNPARFLVSWAMLVLLWSSAGCVSYESRMGESDTELIRDSARTRRVVVGEVKGGSLLVSATESWERELRRTTTQEGEFEVEMTLSLVAEAPEMIVVSPVLLALDLLALVVTGPIATIDALLSGTVVEDITSQMTEPCVGVSAKVTSGSWAVDGVTGQQGDLLIDLREPAALALCDGGAMSYSVHVVGEPQADGELTLAETLACASLPESEEPATRFAYWQELVAKAQPSKARELMMKRADRVDPATLDRYRNQHDLPAAMSLLHVDYYRALAEQYSTAKAAADHAEWSRTLSLMGGLMAPHDERRGEALYAQSLVQAAAFVEHYYDDRPLRSTPSFMVSYCAHGLNVAQRSQDHRSAAIFSSVLAVSSGDIGKLVHGDLGDSDRAVRSMHGRAREELQRQAALAAYAEEMARIKREEEAWHYRYLNGRGGRSRRDGGVSNGFSSSSNYRGARGPSVAEQARAHQNWLQTQKRNAANRNRAFDQFDRRR